MNFIFMFLFLSMIVLKVASELAPIVIAVVAVKALRHYRAKNGPLKPSRLFMAFKAAKAELFKKS